MWTKFYGLKSLGVVYISDIVDPRLSLRLGGGGADDGGRTLWQEARPLSSARPALWLTEEAPWTDSTPANTRRSANACTVLGQRRRRWANTVTLYQHWLWFWDVEETRVYATTPPPAGYQRLTPTSHSVTGWLGVQGGSCSDAAPSDIPWHINFYSTQCENCVSNSRLVWDKNYQFIHLSYL